MKKLHLAILVSSSALALAGCGADDVVAPNGNVIVNPAPTPGPSPSPTPSAGTVAAAAGCTAGTTDLGIVTLKDSRGTIRNCGIPNTVSGTLNLTARRADGVMYSMNGRTDVGADVRGAGGGAAATLNVSEGVTVFALTGDTSLVVNRGSKINATGSAAAPIIFTALDNLTSTSLNEVSTKLWGGIVINGQAPVSDCETLAGSASLIGGNTNCWKAAEGFGNPRPIYGGNIDGDNSGTMSFIQVNFAGISVGTNDEINSITLNGVGSGTTINNIQVHNGADDGIEIFGGTVNLKRLVLTGNADDSLDTDNGYRGAIQYVLAVRHPDGFDGDGGLKAETILEVDSSPAAAQRADANPRQFLKLANFTFIQNKEGETSIRLRGGADVALLNGIVVSKPSGAQGCFDVNDGATVQAAAGTEFNAGDVAGAEAGPPILRSVVFDCTVVNDPDADTHEQTTINNPLNAAVNTAFVNSLQFLTGSSIGSVALGSTESTVAGAANMKSGAAYSSTFFDQVGYIGAFSGVGDTWTQGWTCNSKIVDLRGATNCAQIRIS